MITLRQNVLEKIRDERKLRLIVQIALDVSYPTLQKYIKENNSALTNANVLKALKENSEFKTDSELLQK